jgi:SulP family sulfate permease
MIFDFKRVEVVDPAVRSLFEAFARRGAEAGLDIALAGLADAEAERALLPLTTAVHHFKDTDSALEWFEDSIISECLPSRQTQLGLLDHPLMRYMGADAPGLEKLLTRVTSAAGDTVITQGAAADSIFLVVSGIADVSLSLPDASLGEMALLDRGPRSAGVYAKTELVCYELTLEPESAFPVPPEVKAKLVEFLAGDLADRLRRANNEIAALAT